MGGKREGGQACRVSSRTLSEGGASLQVKQWPQGVPSCCPRYRYSPHLVRFEQPHAYLHPPPLPVRHGVEALVQVDVQELDETSAPGGVDALHAEDHLPGADVALRGGEGRVGGGEKNTAKYPVFQRKMRGEEMGVEFTSSARQGAG